MNFEDNQAKKLKAVVPSIKANFLIFGQSKASKKAKTNQKKKWQKKK